MQVVNSIHLDHPVVCGQIKVQTEIDEKHLLEELAPNVLEFMVGAGSWATYTTGQGCSGPIVVEKMTRDDGLVMFRVRSIVPYSFARVVKAVYDNEERNQYDHAVLLMEPVKQIRNENDYKIDIIRTISAPAAKGMIAAREFMDVRVVVPVTDGLLVCQESVECTYSPDEACKNEAIPQNLVRGWTYPSGSLVRQVGPNQTEIVELVCTTLRGNIPNWLVNRNLPYIRMAQQVEFHSYLASTDSDESMSTDSDASM